MDDFGLQTPPTPTPPVTPPTPQPETPIVTPPKKKFPLKPVIGTLIALLLVSGTVLLSRQLVQQRQTAEPLAVGPTSCPNGQIIVFSASGQPFCTTPTNCLAGGIIINNACIHPGNCQNNTGDCLVKTQIGVPDDGSEGFCDGPHWTTCEAGYVCQNFDCVPEGGGGGGQGFDYQRCPTGTELIKYPGTGQVTDLCLVPGECDRYFPSRHYITDDDPDDCNKKPTRGPCEVGFLCCPPGSTITCTGTTITRSGTKCNAGEVMMSADWGAQTVVCKSGCGCGGDSPSPSPTITIPNCTGLTTTADLNNLQTGTEYSFQLTAGGTAPITSVEMSVYGSSCSNDLKPYAPQAVSGPGTYTIKWTPAIAGPFTAYGRVWNDGISECRAACVDGPPRYLCANAQACKLTGTVAATANPTISCTGLTTNVAAPVVGQSVTGTCHGSFSSVTAPVARFGVSIDGGEFMRSEIIPLNAAGEANYTVTVPIAATYLVQCQICTDATASTCTTWGQAN